VSDPLFSTVLESLTSGVLAVDMEGRVLFVNRALAQRLGVTPESCVAKPGPELFSAALSHVPPKRTPLYRLDPRRDAGRTHSREVEWNDGKRTVHLREDSAPLRDASDQVIGRLFAYHDQSWEKTIDQMKSEFISIASHELRTPMTSIKGSVDLILGGCAGEVSEEAREMLDVAHSACDRMIRLINDILDLSKIEAGQIKLKLTPLHLTDAAESSVRSLKALAAQDEITLKLETPEELPRVQGDRDRLEQVITNLVSNAIKYSPAKGEVAIRLAAENGWVSCSVSDQGCGIEEKDLERIFGKFQQVGSPQRGGGTGLGLAITHALVTEHKGKIWVESRVGAGSCFVFCVPVASPQPPL
jgi:signal transduction histidine kinase